MVSTRHVTLTGKRVPGPSLSDPAMVCDQSAQAETTAPATHSVRQGVTGLSKCDSHNLHDGQAFLQCEPVLPLLQMRLQKWTQDPRQGLLQPPPLLRGEQSG